MDTLVKTTRAAAQSRDALLTLTMLKDEFVLGIARNDTADFDVARATADRQMQIMGRHVRHIASLARRAGMSSASIVRLWSKNVVPIYELAFVNVSGPVSQLDYVNLREAARLF